LEQRRRKKELRKKSSSKGSSGSSSGTRTTKRSTSKGSSSSVSTSSNTTPKDKKKKDKKEGTTTTTTTTGEKSKSGGSSIMTQVIYPTLSEMLKNNNTEVVINALSNFKQYFETAEQESPGFTFNLVSILIKQLQVNDASKAKITIMQRAIEKSKIPKQSAASNYLKKQWQKKNEPDAEKTITPMPSPRNPGAQGVSSTIPIIPINNNLLSPASKLSNNNNNNNNNNNSKRATVV